MIVPKFRYSPRFRHPIADVFIPLTGSRAKDYKIAEERTGIAHVGRKTVWHHVWNMDQNGNYEIQLVDYKIHSKTCPHAGGSKLWCLSNNVSVYKRTRRLYVNKNLYGFSIGNHKVGKTGMISASNAQDDDAYVVDYIFDDHLSDIKRINSIYIRGSGRRIRITPWALDPYGNVFYKGKNSLFVYDHELDELIELSAVLNDFIIF